MSRPAFRHVGGEIFDEHGGRVTLEEATEAAERYLDEVLRQMELDHLNLALGCLERGVCAYEVALEAQAWRLAAGWEDPRDADDVRRRRG